MSKFEDYLEKAKDLAEEAGDMAKKAAGEVMDRAKDLSDEKAKVKELMNNAKEQTSAAAFGVKEKIQDAVKDINAVKEIKQGIADLEALPEIEGSIVYSMEVGALVSDLRSLAFVIGDKRLDDASVAEEITKTLTKVKPEDVSPETELTEEQKAIYSAKVIAYNACVRALKTLNPGQ